MGEKKDWRKKYYNERLKRQVLEAILKVVSADALNMRVAPSLLGEAEKALAYLDKLYSRKYPPWLREFWRKAIERRKQHEQKMQEQKKEQKTSKNLKKSSQIF
jgi:thiamine pyrophosphate-dependent acetolactate synthase large subunit-like protein